MIRSASQTAKGFEIDLYPIESYDGMAFALEALAVDFDVRVETRLDGPDARIWKGTIEGVEFELSHEDGIGNFLKLKTDQMELADRIVSYLNEAIA